MVTENSAFHSIEIAQDKGSVSWLLKSVGPEVGLLYSPSRLHVA